MNLDQDQQQAVALALSEKVLILTGGPGVGKTFTTNHILEALDLPYSSVALAAPTGKAARRMSEATFGRQARTIHRLLEYSPFSGGFQRNEDFPLSEDLIIIDEASMLDTRLADCLFQAVRPEAKLILVGDKDQLPSVGPGNVFRDLIASGVIPVAELNQIHRQSEHSWIPVNARKINNGQSLTIDPLSEDFFVVNHEEAAAAREAIIRLVCKDIPGKHGLNPLTDIQLLCPQKKGTLGVFELNEELQGRLNPPRPGEETFRGFRIRDKVIHMRNNYGLDVMNGECGQVVAIEDKVVSVDYGDREIVYAGEDLDDLALSYAMTIHKSQGSEWPCVVLPIHSYNAFMLNRNLFYTGVTRGKALVYVVGNDRGLARAIKNNAAQKRHTGLVDRLREAFGAGIPEAA